MPLKDHVPAIAVETFSVVLGVLLALAVNAWREDGVHHVQVDVALQTIRREIAANRELLTERLPYHQSMRDSLRALVGRTRGQTTPGGLQVIKTWQGVQPTRLVDDAWHTAGATGLLQYMPYPLVLELSQTYSTQNRLQDVNRGLATVVYSPSFAANGVAALASVDSYLADIAETETQLVSQYDSSLRAVSGALDGLQPGSPPTSHGPTAALPRSGRP